MPANSRQSRSVPGLPPPQPPSSQPSLLSQSTMYQGSPAPPVTNAVGAPGGGGAPDSRSMTPHAYRLVYSPGLPSQNPQMTAAEHLNNLNSSGNKAVQVEKKQPEEFNHAIQYLNKIKARYAEEPNTYKQFLDILQTYHKEQKHSNDVSLYVFLWHESLRYLGIRTSPKALCRGAGPSEGIQRFPSRSRSSRCRDDRRNPYRATDSCGTFVLATER